MPSIHMPRRTLLIAAVGLACVGAPSLAEANDFCVHDMECTQAGGTDYLTLEDALAAAEGGPSADRILIGPGTYTAPYQLGFTAVQYPVQIVGSGTKMTALTAPDGASNVLTLGNANSSVSNLLIVVPASNDQLTKTALGLMGGTASHVAIATAQGASTSSNGVQLHGGLLEDSTVDVPTTVQAKAVIAQAGARIRNVSLTGAYGVQMTGADVQVDRARISATQAGVWAWGMNGLVTNSEIRPLGGANGITAASSGGADASMAIRNVTIVGDGGGSTGVWAVNNTGHTVTASVDNTVIGGVKRAFARDGGAVGAANLGVEYSDFDPSGLSSNGLGSFVMGDGNISADPLFSSTLDFHPLAGSPLVDAGDPVSFSDALDLDGHPRVLAGRRDIGAYETPPAAATPAAETSPAASPAATTTVDPGAAPRDTAAPSIAGLKIAPARFTARHGARIGFKLSERASVVVAIKRQGAHRSRLTNVATLRHSEPAGSSRIAIRRRVGRVTLTPGRYVAVVSAADAAGNRSRSYRLGFQIIAG